MLQFVLLKFYLDHCFEMTWSSPCLVSRHVITMLFSAFNYLFQKRKCYFFSKITFSLQFYFLGLGPRSSGKILYHTVVKMSYFTNFLTWMVDSELGSGLIWSGLERLLGMNANPLILIWIASPDDWWLSGVGTTVVEFWSRCLASRARLTS